MVTIHESNNLIHGFNPFQYSYAPHLWTANYHPYYWNKYAYYGTSDHFEDNKLMAQTSSSFDAQSDSDTSVSSYEPLTTIDIGLIQKSSVNDVKCCWKNCGLWFPTLDKLANHITKCHAASGPGGLFFCGWEGCVRNMRGFNARYKMLVHVRTHTNEKPHQCTVCDKSFSRAENLKIHFRSHSGEKPYVCPVAGCNKAYSNSSDRFKHTRTHQVDKPYMCKVPGCLKRYTDPSSLRKHVKTYRHFVSVAVDPKMGIVSTKNEVGSVMMFEKEIDDETTVPMTAIPVMNESVHHETEYTDDFPPKNGDNMKKEFKKNNNVQCNCRHTCNLAKNNSNEKHFISTLLSLNDASEVKSWDRFWVPSITQKDNGHKVFYTNPIMDLDMPLDLSISRD